jgi:uncharacterized protein with HEPN domain
MVKPILADRFIHILDAIAQVRLRTAGLDLETFKKDRFLQLGVERCLEIISEATRHIPADLKDRQTTIPWRRISDIGNRIRHSYHAIDSEIIWEIARSELGELNDVIVKMRDEATGP